MKITTAFIVVVFALGACTGSRGVEKIEDVPGFELSDDVQSAVEVAILGLDNMRSSLAGTIGADEVNGDTFARVCKPVGMQARQIGESNGWEVKQVAIKNRNSTNQADIVAARLSAFFEAEAGRDSLWLRTKQADIKGWRYLRRITVEPSCLACHGTKESRPAFVKEKYPDDRAFDFEVGDLRGLYSVFVPDDSLTSLAMPEPAVRVLPEVFVTKHEGAVALIDVRTPEEFQEGFLVDAANIDVKDTRFVEQILELDPDKTYYLYCRTGNRAGMAGVIMQAMGFTSLYNIGGYEELKESGAAVVGE